MRGLTERRYITRLTTLMAELMAPSRIPWDNHPFLSLVLLGIALGLGVMRPTGSSASDSFSVQSPSSTPHSGRARPS